MCIFPVVQNWRQNLLKLVTFVKKPKLVQNTVGNYPVARDWRQNTLRNRRFPLNWPELLGSQSM